VLAANVPAEKVVPVVSKKKAPVVKKTVVAKKPIVEAPFSLAGKAPVAVEVKELPSAAVPMAAALYAAEPTTPVIVTEIVRIDSISLQAPTIAEQEAQPLPRLPQPDPVVASIVPAPLPTALAVAPHTGRVDVPVASASMDDLPSLEAPSVDTIRNNSRLHPNTSNAHPTAVVAMPMPAPIVYAPQPQMAAPTPVVTATAPVRSSPVDPRDARIQALLDELKTLQRNPIVVQAVQPPVEVVVPHHVVVPKIDPAATIQLPLAEEPRPLIKPMPKEPARMVTEHAPKTAVDVPQTASIDAPRAMTPAPVLEPRVHRVANPKFAGLPEKGDFIAFMPGSSHVSEETTESLRSMVDVFKQHGIRKIVLTGTALRDEDTEQMESSDFAQKRAQNLKAAFQRAGFKGVIALDDPKRARPGTTPRVGLVALQ
jgi:outer membrane protein OmpA-like peptidoglycan-associated protein